MIDLVTIKQHCNIELDFNEDDNLLNIYMKMAAQYVSNVTRRTLYQSADSDEYKNDPRPLLIDELITGAMLQLIGHWYENRETINIGNITSEIPITTNSLLQPYIIYGV